MYKTINIAFDENNGNIHEELEELDKLLTEGYQVTVQEFIPMIDGQAFLFVYLHKSELQNKNTVVTIEMLEDSFKKNNTATVNTLNNIFKASTA